MKPVTGWLFLVVLCFWPCLLPADTNTLTSVADASLLEVAPNNNDGGMPYVNCGTTQNGARSRALLKFDPSASVPRGARITSALLQLYVELHSSAGYAIANFELHRLLRDWGEGANTYLPGSVGQGAPATVGQVSWNDRFALTDSPWAVPGGSESYDYSPAISAHQVIYTEDQSPYYFSNDPSEAPQLIADIQSWLDEPDRNFGWLLVQSDESVRFTARRVGSREGPIDFAPQLFLQFVPPIDRLESTRERTRLFFTAQTGAAYAIQAATNLLLNSWFTLTNLPALTNLPPSVSSTNLVITDQPRGVACFYRLMVQ